MSSGCDKDQDDNNSNYNAGEKGDSTGNNSCSVNILRSSTSSSSSQLSEITLKLPGDGEKPVTVSEVGENASTVEAGKVNINGDCDDDDDDVTNKDLATNSKDVKIKVEEKLQKLVYILQSSEDRDEKLETLRLIAELAESLPDIRTDLDETVLADISIDDIPLPSYPPLESIPIPSEASSTSKPTKEGIVEKPEKLPDGISRPQRRESQGEDTAVTKTRLGVVTLHKNKSSARFAMTRSSLNELMPIEKLREAQEKLSKMKMAKLAKKKIAADGEHSEAINEISGGRNSFTGEVGTSSRKMEIQQRINAWKEELLRDASRNTKRKKLTMPFETDDASTVKNVTSATAGGSTTDAKLHPSDTAVQKSDAKNIAEALQKENHPARTPSELGVKHTATDVGGMLNKFSISVTDKDGKKKYLWPIEMVKKTKTTPSLVYSCNPLYYDFPLQQSSSLSLGKIRKSGKRPSDVKAVEKVKDAGELPSTPKKPPVVGDSLVEAKKVYTMLESRTSATSYSAVPPARKESSNFDDDVEESGAAKWDTSSDSESERPDKASLPAVKKSSADDSRISTKSKVKDSNFPSHGGSSAESERSSNYTSSYRSTDSRSRSRSYSSRASRRHRRRRRRRSYRSRSRSYSTDSFSSYSSRGSYSSSRSRSNRRRKRRRYSRSSASRSYSRGRYSHRSSSRSRSRSPYRAKRFKSASQEVKRVISHKILPAQIKKNSSPAPKAGPPTFQVQKSTMLSKPSASTSDVKSTVALASSTANASTCPAIKPASLNIPLPARSSSPDPPPPFIGPTLPLDHPLCTMRDIPLPQNDLPVEEKFQYIGPNDPLVFKNKSQSTTSEGASNDNEKKEKDPTASFAIPPEQAERYRALRLQAERHARKVMGSLTTEEEMEEEEEACQAAATSLQLTNSLTDNGGNPQQQLVEELYREQMASLMAQQQQHQQQQQQHQHIQQQQQQQLQQQQIIIGNSQTPVGRLVHIIAGQQNVASAASPQLIPVLQVAPKVVSALPQAGAPVILAPSNATGHHLATSGGPTLIQLQTEDQAHARARLQQARIELAERTLGEMHAAGARQEWVQIVQVPQQQQPTGLIFTHPIHQQAHHLGIPFIQRPNLLFRTARKAPTLIQVSGSGQIVSPTFIGAQQVIAAQQSPQQTIPVFLGAGGQMLVPRFFR